MTGGRARLYLPMSAALRRWGLVFGWLLAMVGCDHATKYAAKAGLEGQPPQPVIPPVLELRYTENTDAAFSLLRWMPDSARGPFLLAFGAVALGALGLLLARNHQAGLLTRAALLLLLGGALGNYLDRLARGYVVDFIHLTHWPVFNVADVLVSAGLVLMAWTTLRRPDRAAPHPAV
jgi:signal peptidase II